MKFILPNNLETPARCKEKMTISMDNPECPMVLLKGGYMVQPVPAPLPHKNPAYNRVILGGSNQKLKLLRRGNLISGVISISGMSQLPNPPIRVGIIMKKIIRRA
jgi:hypothetical protein